MPEDSAEQFVLRVLSGERHGIVAASLRMILSIVEPLYAGVMRVRNAFYNAGLFTSALPRPVISIGNITTGGTGKTPTVQWIARHLLASGRHPAVLLRGYRKGGATMSDEAQLLSQSLKIPVRANADRVAAAGALLSEHPGIEVLLLDDAFQHRRVRRDLDIVLIDATHPFGHNHLLPRGLLREPLSGMARADIFIVTRSDLASDSRLRETEAGIRRHNPSAPIFRARHRITSIVNGTESRALETLRGVRIFSFCGIGNPTGFHLDLHAAGAIDPGHRSFADHHEYSREEIAILTARAKETGAALMITTEKDWVKIEPLLAQPNEIPIWRAQVEIDLNASDAAALRMLIDRAIVSVASPPGRV